MGNFSVDSVGTVLIQFLYVLCFIDYSPPSFNYEHSSGIYNASGGGLASGVRQGEAMTRGVYCWGPVVSVSQ